MFSPSLNNLYNLTLDLITLEMKLAPYRIRNRNKVQKNGSVKIQDFLYAWPWDGTPAWQTVIIFMP